MPEELFNPEKHKNSKSADEFEKFLGNEAEDHLYKRLLNAWRTHGKEDAKRFCINDADKFPIGEDRVKLYLEENLFDAGVDGLSKKTPWNTYRRQKAGLPLLHSFE